MILVDKYLITAVARLAWLRWYIIRCTTDCWSSSRRAATPSLFAPRGLVSLYISPVLSPRYLCSELLVYDIPRMCITDELPVLDMRYYYTVPCTIGTPISPRNCETAKTKVTVTFPFHALRILALMVPVTTEQSTVDDGHRCQPASPRGVSYSGSGQGEGDSSKPRNLG